MSKNDGKAIQVVNKSRAGFIFFVAYIGAAVYFVHQSHGFWGFILALLKALVWPAYVVYHALTVLHA